MPHSLDSGLRQPPQSAFPKTVTYCGWLDIRTNKTHDWRRRYFVLSNNFLLSAETPVASKIRRVIPLEGSHVRVLSTHFDIILQRKKYYFCCGSPRECANWVAKIEKASKLKITELYRFVDTLGLGPNSKVVGARHRVTGNSCAIKIVDKRKCDRRLLANEVQILKRLDHPYVVEMFDLFETKRYLYLVMERCEGGELFEFIAGLDGGHYTEKICCQIMYQVAEAVRYMHSLGIVHRDLKPENILCIQEDDCTRVKLADFGISRISEAQEQMQTLCGTLIYTAPEVLRRSPYTYRCDHWSLGVIMHILLCGYPPFVGTTDATTIHSIINDDLVLQEEDWEHVSRHGRDLVVGLLQRDPQERKSVNDIVDHAWLQSSRDAAAVQFPQKLRQYLVQRRLQKNSLSVLERSSKTKGYYRTTDDTAAQGSRGQSFGQKAHRLYGWAQRGSRDAEALQLRLPVGLDHGGRMLEIDAHPPLFEEPDVARRRSSSHASGRRSSFGQSSRATTVSTTTGVRSGRNSRRNSSHATEVA